MKKYICIIAAAILLLTSCNIKKADKADDASLSVVATIFPEYDWVREILGDNPSGVRLRMLSDSGVDMHSYQPSPADILDISDCDIFIYVGGESDKWVDDVLKTPENENMTVIKLLDIMGDNAKTEEYVEGMEHDEEETGYDEHVWLSLKNSVIFCDAIADALIAADPSNADTYTENAASYTEKLRLLDDQYEKVVSEANVKTLLFGDRFPFRYMTDDYAIKYYAAFAGCEAETEASFETITFLANKMDELSLSSIMTLENSDQRIARTIIENTHDKNQDILELDSMQSTTTAAAEGGASYLAIMQSNLDVLQKALQ